MRIETEITEQLRYRFESQEHLSNAEQLAAKLDYANELETNNKAIKADLKQKEELATAEIGKLTRLVRDKFEMRETRCKWDFNRPRTGMKTLVRLDTFEDVREHMMLDHERQEVLRLEMPSHMLSGPGLLAGKKVSELVDSDVDYFASRDEDELLKFGWKQEDIAAVFEEAKRRAGEKPGPVLVEAPTSTAEIADASASVNESAVQFISEVRQAEEQEIPRCPHCDAGQTVTSADGTHEDGLTCINWLAAMKASSEEPVEPQNTLPSARAVINGTADRKRPRRSRHDPAPLTAEEREHLEAAQTEEIPEVPAPYETDDMPF